jgi:hypothetical protein
LQSLTARAGFSRYATTKLLPKVGICILVVVQPEIGIPLAVSDLSGVPVGPSPAALETSIASQSERVLVNSADEVVSLEQRASQIHSALPTATQRRTTTAVASATDAEGKSVTLVASSEKNIRPAQRAVLQPGEVAVSGKGHAEATIINHANANGIKVSQVAASRPICQGCAATISSAGAQSASAIKKENQKLVQQATLGKF